MNRSLLGHVFGRMPDPLYVADRAGDVFGPGIGVDIDGGELGPQPLDHLIR
ncbi:hypothetical protein [Gemmata obscuriglobus]|uniref:hypothetical protein n=1 Tax=Gemmata obscuriglobus TaxID=114 RepID=UPI00016C35F6|nr:hypothetical protein [Gemmata obscuriglobus]